MKLVQHLKAGLVMMALWFPPAVCQAGQALPVDWGSNTITAGQLQTLMNANPGYSGYMIRFPSGLNWNIGQRDLQGLLNAYMQHAQAIGLEASPQQLIFSSTGGRAGGAGRGAATIPLNQLNGNMQMMAQNVMNQLDYEKYYLASFLPEWLKNSLVAVLAWLGRMWDYAMLRLGR